MSVDFARCIPVLASLDITETRDFHVGQLSFTGDYAEGDYLIVKRDGRCTKSSSGAARPGSRRSR